MVEHSGKDIINIAGSPAHPSEGKDASADAESGLKLKKEKTTEKKKTAAKGKSTKKRETVKEKEEVPLHKLMKVEEMKNIKYNRLVFGEGSKDKSVHDKFKAFNRQSQSAKNIPGRLQDQQRPRSSAYENWLVDCGLRRPRPSQHLNQDLSVFYPGVPQYGRI